MELNDAERKVLLGCLLMPDVFSVYDYGLIRRQFVGPIGSGELIMLFYKGAMERAGDDQRSVRISEAGRRAIEEMT